MYQTIKFLKSLYSFVIILPLPDEVIICERKLNASTCSRANHDINTANREQHSAVGRVLLHNTVN